jgi:hypothetical protein
VGRKAPRGRHCFRNLDDKDLLFASRVRAGFVPATRRDVFAKIKGLKPIQCPFANVPEKSEGRWGQGLTADKMKGCIWLKPEAVVRISARGRKRSAARLARSVESIWFREPMSTSIRLFFPFKRGPTKSLPAPLAIQRRLSASAQRSSSVRSSLLALSSSTEVIGPCSFSQ